MQKIVDFKNRYEEYSNAELLNILKNATNYQPEAVDAAKEILSQREIAPEDYQHANTIVYEQNIEDNKFQQLTSSFTGLFDFYTNRKNISVGAAITLAIIAYQFFSLKNIIIVSISTIKLYYETPLYLFLIFLEYILYTALILISIYYLLKRDTWGWAIITGLILLRFVSSCAFIYTYFQIEFKPESKAIFYALAPIVYLVIVFLKPTRDFLNVKNTDYYKVGYIIFILAILNGYIYVLNYLLY